MNDTLMVFYDSCPPDVPTLCVAKEANEGFNVLNMIQGDEAFGVYYYLVNGAELKSVKEIPKKPIGDLHSVPHYRCPNCNKAIVVYEFDYKYPHCKWCGQAIDW